MKLDQNIHIYSESKWILDFLHIVGKCRILVATNGFIITHTLWFESLTVSDFLNTCSIVNSIDIKRNVVAGSG